ncbi:effector-associated domain 2-containing protein [Amycolatopsis sp. cmx-4-61]|uniref:VMAP-C domain-containing protein n=1 Tax=Amycolatopsis sp. cmx-4-61 TaxID=2790937 RepID=UPI00397A8919
MSAGERTYGPSRELQTSSTVRIAVREAIVNLLAKAGLAADRPTRSLLVDLIHDNLGFSLTLSEHASGRDQLIDVVNACARSEGGMHALDRAVRMLRPGSPEAELLHRLVHEPRMHDLLPDSELLWLRSALTGVVPPRLSALLRRSANPAACPAGEPGDAWDAFCLLTELNTPAHGLPPALIFIELVAAECPRPLGEQLREWNTWQARRVQGEARLHELRAEHKPGAGDGLRLHLVIMVEVDGIDPDLHVVSHWRQEDPREWPPARGGMATVQGTDLEHHVDRLVVDAERAWAEYREEVALEFILPRALVNLPVHRWCKEHETGDPRPLSLDYPIVIRSLERMFSRQWHRAWRIRWEAMLGNPSAEQVYYCRPDDTAKRHRLDATLSDGRWLVMVLAEPPPVRPRPGEDELATGLRTGIPALLWHPHAPAEVVRELVAWLVDGGGLGDLPARTRDSRRASFREVTIPVDLRAAGDLVILWDDPSRLIFLDDGPYLSDVTRENADERGKAS